MVQYYDNKSSDFTALQSPRHWRRDYESSLRATTSHLTRIIVEDIYCTVQSAITWLTRIVLHLQT